MKKITIILFFLPLLANSQHAIVNGLGEITNYVKYMDSVPGYLASQYRLKIKTDSLAAAVAASTAASLALKLNLSDTAAMLTNYTRNSTTILKLNISDTANMVSGYLRKTGNGSLLTGLTASQVGLGNVTNESKATMFTSPAFTGTPTGITATHVGLGNVTNESKATMFTNPAFTGTPTGIGLPVYGRVTGSNVTTTGQALVDITGLTVALVINATYEFEAVLSGSVTAVTTGNQYGINYSVAGGAIEAQVTGAFTSTASKTERITALNTATSAFLTTSAQTGGIVIKGIVTTGANAGNLTVKHLKVTSGTSTVFINSFLKVTRIL